MREITIGTKFIYKADRKVFLLQARKYVRNIKGDYSSTCFGCDMVDHNCSNIKYMCRGESSNCNIVFKILKHKDGK